jgi:hypothetical protein
MNSMDKRNEDNDQRSADEKLQGSKSDPQKTELEGLKQGGKEPVVHEEDKARDEDGNID